jgi:DNA modification methylase
MRYELIEGEARVLLAQIPESIVQCVVTSPPYWGLRDYGLKGEGIGLEKTPT